MSNLARYLEQIKSYPAKSLGNFGNSGTDNENSGIAVPNGSQVWELENVDKLLKTKEFPKFPKFPSQNQGVDLSEFAHVPPIYRAGMAELIGACPDGVFWQYHQWAIADCATFFKSPFGQAAAEFSDSNDCVGWTAEHLFTPPIHGKRGGLLWWLRGAEIEAMGGDWARNDGGEVFDLLANNLTSDI